MARYTAAVGGTNGPGKAIGHTLEAPPRRNFSYFGVVQPRMVQIPPVGVGSPSAILGSAAVVRKRARAAKASMNRFTVVLLCEEVRTVVYCIRQKRLLYLLKSHCYSGNRKKMRLKSAIEDFEANTLGAVSGLLSRLSYVGRLHDGKGTHGGTGRYEHWGLAKVYGDEAAQRAIGASHRAVLSEVLRKPLASLLNDMPASCANEHLTEREFLATLAEANSSLPKPLSRAALAHLRAVLSALSALVESRNNANLQDASPPPQPAQEPRPPAGT
jgi:hypothetical protein